MEQQCNQKRFTILNRIADLIDVHEDELALAETNDNGKPLWLSKLVDIRRASDNFRFCNSHYAFCSESHSTTGKMLLTIHCASPLVWWVVSLLNLPLYLFMENCACTGSRQLRYCKAKRSNTCYLFLLGKICKKPVCLMVY